MAKKGSGEKESTEQKGGKLAWGTKREEQSPIVVF